MSSWPDDIKLFLSPHPPRKKVSTQGTSKEGSLAEKRTVCPCLAETLVFTTLAEQRLKIKIILEYRKM